MPKPQVYEDPGVSLLAKRYHTVAMPLPLEVELRTWVHPAGGVRLANDQ